MTSNLKNSPEFACRTCVKQHCGCKNTECPLPCHFYTEQAEQEPVAWTYEEVKSAFEYLKLQVKGPDDKWTVGESCTYFGFFRHGIDAATQRRTSPVRTKDLTEAEIDDIWEKHSGGNLGFAYAVIAADREKNRG